VVITIKLKVRQYSMIPGGRNNQAKRKGSIMPSIVGIQHV
tara:strand:+ start:341 stop:460 length:120 start_codon:yes stop_codon:yes gene_type:complete